MGVSGQENSSVSRSRSRDEGLLVNKGPVVKVYQLTLVVTRVAL